MKQAPLVGLVASQEQANDICPSTFLGLIDCMKISGHTVFVQARYMHPIFIWYADYGFFAAFLNIVQLVKY